MTDDDPLTRAWPRALPPRGRSCRHWAPTGLQGLACVRQDFREQVAEAVDGSPGMSSDQVEDAVTALDEMVSNALRHGLAPIAVEVCAHDRGYVLLVSDHAPDAPPQPTSVRDPVDGGMGLGMIASTALACGWFADPCVKTVWALMPRVAAGR